MATIIPLTNVQPDMVEQLLDRVFGPERHARTAYRIRDGAQWLETLSFAALDEEDYLVGTIQLWPIALTCPDGRSHPMIMVGPVAVVPEKHNEGFGKALMLAALDALTSNRPDGGTDGQNDVLPQVMIGDPDYYGRFFGFTALPTAQWHCPGPFDRARLLVRCAHCAALPAEGMLGPWPSDLPPS